MTIFDETQRWKYLRVPLSGLLLHKRADSLDIRISYWAGTVRGHALSQTHAAAAGAAGLIGMVQDLLLLLLGESGEVDLAEVSVRIVTGPLHDPRS
jgi:hypothetical protein